MNKNTARIGIVGLGYVGGAVRYWFERARPLRSPLFFYDKYKNIGSPQDVNKADIVFVCVPTPYHEGKGYDDSAVREALAFLKPGKIVMLKSTILPGSTEGIQKKFPQHYVLFNPEFLRAKTAQEDFLKPERQIVGYTNKSKKFAKKALGLLPRAPYTKTMPATEAEMVKYFGNTFLSARVIFANQFYDLCKRLRIDYDAVREAAGTDSRIGTSHFDIWHEGYRGYGGGCLPKDTRAIIDFAETKGADFGLLKKIEEINNKLRISSRFLKRTRKGK